MDNNIYEYVKELCVRAKSASCDLAVQTSAEKNKALAAIASKLRENVSLILAENEKDLSCAEANGVPKTMMDRLRLTEQRIIGMADAVMEVAALADPIGEGTVSTRPNGLKITCQRVPIGVVGIIYEARPNVTVDAAALCIKSGNAVVLRGGKEAINTNRILVKLMREVFEESFISSDAVALIDDVTREGTNALMSMRGLVDVLIPRGGKGLIKAVVENAKVPVIETGAGNCHVYIDERADMFKALRVAVNAKVSRPSVCNAAETLLVHRAVAEEFLPKFYDETRDVALEIRGCERTCSILPQALPATEEDYDTEYNDYIISVKVVDDVHDAVTHIRKYTTGHSEAIVTEDYTSARYFTTLIDAAAVYVNASTRFTDGGEFGFGAEIGISTQKLHARGPMGLSHLTTVKYIVEGNGQVR
ncbi:MAG: glutamate-5-semialdehyde dehydrogenase [Ruminococcaceae bacterium]|nr:glutamate-5-semialdehyde dehydrogenase [Oscillospiraceae bacterium]MBQ9691953.1 glutamate-5-semialdehyde dehydrogenase [Clostridia bacterium]